MIEMRCSREGYDETDFEKNVKRCAFLSESAQMLHSLLEVCASAVCVCVCVCVCVPVCLCVRKSLNRSSKKLARPEYHGNWFYRFGNW